MVSLLSYNIEFGTKLDRIRQWLKAQRLSPEILCFQEFPASQIRAFIAELEPGRYCSHYAPAFRKPKEVFGQLTLIDRFAFQDEETFIVPYGVRPFERVVAKVKNIRFFPHKQRFTVIHHLRRDGMSFAVANTHLSALTTNTRRLYQLDPVLDALQKFDHAVIVGDLNYTSLWRRRALFEIMAGDGFENGTENIKTHRLRMFLSLKQQLDYLFHKNCRIEDVTLFPVPFADHYPFLVKFDLVPAVAPALAVPEEETFFNLASSGISE